MNSIFYRHTISRTATLLLALAACESPQAAQPEPPSGGHLAGCDSASKLTLPPVCTQTAEADCLQTSNLKSSNNCPPVTTNQISSRSSSPAEGAPEPSATCAIKPLCIELITTPSCSSNSEICNKIKALLDASLPKGYTVNDSHVTNIHLPRIPFIAPHSGLYVAITKLPDALTKETPVAIPHLIVNGRTRATTRFSFLTIDQNQTTNISNILTLNAGDQVTIVLLVVMIDPTTGQIIYPNPNAIELASLTEPLDVSLHLLATNCDHSTMPAPYLPSWQEPAALYAALQESFNKSCTSG